MRYRLNNVPDLTTAQVTKLPDGSFEVELGERRLRVECVDRRSASLLVKVAGRLVRVDRVGDRTRIDGRSHSVEILGQHEANLGRGASARAHDGLLKSPMPGRVLRVSVQVGQLVTTTTPVLVVEAMKMENQLFAPVAGMVETVFVAAGQAVEAGATLVKVVPQ